MKHNYIITTLCYTGINKIIRKYFPEPVNIEWLEDIHTKSGYTATVTNYFTAPEVDV